MMSEPPNRWGFSNDCVARRRPRLEVVEPQGDGGGADVEGEAVQRAVGLGEGLAVEEHEAAFAGHRGIQGRQALLEPRRSRSRCEGSRA